EDILKDTIGSVREISNNISPHNLNNYGLVSAIKSFIEREKKLVEINFEENLNDYRLPRIIEIMCYRIVKEMINNTIKYARAQEVWISLSIEDKMFYLSYRDDGIGFDVEEAIENQKTGIGLLNILNRLNTLKATYSFKGKLGEGFNFEMKLRLFS
ncbi:MAG: histidine kinase, partial [Bacteroidetes bacterium HGW-Bacteroidetes-12]